MTNLKTLILGEETTISEIGAYLDGLGEAERRAEVDGLDRALQRRLYQKAGGEGAAPIGLDHFVPDAVGTAESVEHLGKNTLPLPPRHRRFQKRFCRAEGGDGQRLAGYNEAPSRGLIGPGYFVAYETAGSALAWRERGGVVIDYFQVPDGPVAAGWPAIVPNTRGLQRFVYRGTRDFMRRVSAHVSIGIAFRGEKSLDHYFVLCRI